MNTVIITPRLQAGVAVPGGFISMEPTNHTDRFGKPQWRFAIDVDGWEYEDSDLYGWDDAQGMLGTLLAFLTASAEALSYQEATGRESDNADLFPQHVAEWARQHADELALIQWDLEPEEHTS